MDAHAAQHAVAASSAFSSRPEDLAWFILLLPLIAAAGIAFGVRRNPFLSSTLSISAGIGLTTSRDILQAVARGEGPRHMLVTLGYSGWAPGQLEQELAQNAWLTVAARDDVMFELPPAQRLVAAMQMLGVDYATLSEDAGHA